MTRLRYADKGILFAVEAHIEAPRGAGQDAREVSSLREVNVRSLHFGGLLSSIPWQKEAEPLFNDCGGEFLKISGHGGTYSLQI